MAEIKPDTRNYRLHDERNKRLIRKSLTECGAGRSIVIDREDVIVAGNGVYEQARELGLKVRVIESDGTELIAIKRTDLSSEDDRRRLLAMADNRTSDTSEFDLQLLTEDFDVEELKAWEVDTTLYENLLSDDLLENHFSQTVNQSSDVFSITFSFPKAYREQIEGYIRERGKDELNRLIIEHVCLSAEVK